jgi:adenosine/AMP kinase
MKTSDGGPREVQMNLLTVAIQIPDGWNIIFGQSHFIKTVEDLYETLITAGGIKFGLAFSEASQQRLIRQAGNDDDATRVAIENLQNIGAGHSFLIVLKEGFPIQVLNAVKNCSEVCRIFCATANPVEVVLGETDLGRAVLGVVDGNSPLGVEGDEDIVDRQKFLRTIGYKC